MLKVNCRQRIRRVAFLLCSIIMLLSNMKGQTKYVEAYFGIEDGLNSQKLIDITNDTHGFVWILTSLGMMRFDGQTFKNYRPKGFRMDLFDPRNNRTIHATQNGMIYIGKTDGAYYYDYRSCPFRDRNKLANRVRGFFSYMGWFACNNFRQKIK